MQASLVSLDFWIVCCCCCFGFRIRCSVCRVGLYVFSWLNMNGMFE
ncbi:hypothetical protein OIU79_031151 [Salix purpurea]|uniref:Uncharacterized protein n=1 Tax=Salix purpurea TaxID=77065 RepID=A0A9Q0ZS95_SALPP|nr:hypothetical protein OIU79_031151 [Salix purpurea]